jgi:hypothetical protein
VAIQIALVAYQTVVDPLLLTRVAAALHRQVRQDFGPVWGIDASVSAFLEWESVPPDYARVALVDHMDSGALGVHDDRDGLPYALVAAHDDWSLVASHECLEMLADPTGRQIRRGPSPIAGQGQVEFLLEICDPCQGQRWHYVIDGVPVSDFCTPAYYQGTGAKHERWSFRGAFDGPRTVLKDGYLLWHDPEEHAWWRRDWLGAKVADYSLGPISPRVSFLRGHTDRMLRAEKRLTRGSRKLVIKPSKEAQIAARALGLEIDAALGAAPKGAPAIRARRKPTTRRGAR